MLNNVLNNDLSCSHVEFLGCAIEQCTFHSSAVNCILQLFAFCIKTLYLIVLSSPMSYEIFGQGYYNGGFPTIRHNEIGNITAHLMSDVCNNVELEPILQPSPMRGYTITLPTQKMKHMLTSGTGVLGCWSVY